MELERVSIGDIAGVIAALAFAFLVLRTGGLIGKLGNVLASKVGLAALRDGHSLDSAVQHAKDADTNPRQRLLQRLKTGKNTLNAALVDLSDYADDEEVVDAVDEARAAADALLVALERG